MYLEIRRVSIWSAMKLGFVVHLLLSFLFIFPGALLAVELAILSLLSREITTYITTSLVPSSVLCGVAVFLLNAISGAVSWGFVAVVYNTAAWLVGGIKLKFRRPKRGQQDQVVVDPIPEREETPAERRERRVKEEMAKIEERRRR